jgi:hypothetical protein
MVGAQLPTVAMSGKVRQQKAVQSNDTATASTTSKKNRIIWHLIAFVLDAPLLKEHCMTANLWRLLQPARLLTWLQRHAKQDLALTILRDPQAMLDIHLSQRQWLDYSRTTLLLLWWCVAFSILILNEMSVLMATLGSVVALIDLLIILFVLRLYFRFCCFVLRIPTDQDLINHLFRLASWPLPYVLLPTTLLISAGVNDWLGLAPSTPVTDSMAVTSLVVGCQVAAIALVLRCLYVFMLGFHQSQQLTLRRSGLLWGLTLLPVLLIVACNISHRFGLST